MAQYKRPSSQKNVYFFLDVGDVADSSVPFVLLLASEGIYRHLPTQPLEGNASRYILVMFILN